MFFLDARLIRVSVKDLHAKPVGLYQCGWSGSDEGAATDPPIVEWQYVTPHVCG